MRIKHRIKNSQLRHLVKGIFWFSAGAFLGLFLFTSFIFIIFQRMYANVVYPGVMIDQIDFGNKTQEQVKDHFEAKNKIIEGTQFVFRHDEAIATISAKELDYGYNSDLMSIQAFSVGRSESIVSNVYVMLQAYLDGIFLKPSYHFSEDKLNTVLVPISKQLYKKPVDALFSFENGRVNTFQPSVEGQQADTMYAKQSLYKYLPQIISSGSPQIISINIPITILKPKTSTDQANDLGIKELLASGTSVFAGSIPSRIYNVTLAASRVNGVLIAPNETFSFNKALGDVSAFTGYKQAYVIQNGRTVLGDGGGVCQVSTTFFRAVLNAGLPIVERHPHAYRVGYYEQDAPPGLDATIYVPTVDLKFKNDTKHHILVQTEMDPDNARLTFFLYGTKDGRTISLSKPVITSQSKPAEPAYQDDPSLPKGETKQVEHEAYGANVYFTREVKQNGKVIISDKFTSYYRPWQAVFLRGTKEG